MRETAHQRQISDISDSVLQALRETVNPNFYANIFDSGQIALVSLANNTATFVCDTETNATLVRSGFLKDLQGALKQVTETSYDIEVTDRISYERRRKTTEETNRSFFPSAHLSKTMTLDNFVTGPFNKAAYQAALFAVMSPGTSNPIFIYSASGMGKTHLLHGIGNAYKNAHPDANVLYISAEDFVSEFVRFATGNKDSESMKEFFATVDMLLVDDIQLLADKDATQVMFFNVFNLLVSNHKQIVLTSDKAPSELSGLQDRLVSRFSGGLSIAIASPDEETLVKILKMKMKTNNVDPDIFDNEVLTYLADNYSKNVRVLEGAFTKLLFMMTIQKKTGHINLAFVRSVFEEDEVRKAKKGKVTIDSIIDDVAQYYSLTANQLKSRIRTSQIALARQIAMYLARDILKLPYQEIGKSFGGKDHTTVLANCQKISKMMKKDPDVKKTILALSGRVKGESKSR